MPGYQIALNSSSLAVPPSQPPLPDCLEPLGCLPWQVIYNDEADLRTCGVHRGASWGLYEDLWGAQGSIMGASWGLVVRRGQGQSLLCQESCYVLLCAATCVGDRVRAKVEHEGCDACGLKVGIGVRQLRVMVKSQTKSFACRSITSKLCLPQCRLRYLILTLLAFLPCQERLNLI